MSSRRPHPYFPFLTCISCQSISNMSKKDEMPMINMLVRLMKWVVESSLAAVTRRSGKTATLRLSGGCHPTERSWMEQSPSLACTTTPCPTAGWPPVTWKGSGAHVPLSVQAARAPARGYSPTELSTPLAGGFPPFCNILVLFLFFIYLKSKTVKII
ncbi:unnamed protein product [Spirodela intermedia]|uniref:Uncharacterized protein n=1 Tax=Spirodela intermedia TaxID=51605 RepID=A0A7I8IT43_SPIIN|nr:unnamed protein product [Spirodela intermedia]CAA6660773.1 unnamed protein product [Spirodela intermedia]